MADEITETEFTARFKAELLCHAMTFSDGASVADYADMVGPTYWADPDQREDGPEDCARAEMECWSE